MRVVKTATEGSTLSRCFEGRVQRRPPTAHVWCAALSYLLSAASATADPQLRVTGSLNIEASASRRPSGSEVAARLLDDAQHAVAGAAIHIKPLNLDSVRGARTCESHPVALAADEAGAYTVRSNGAGALCVQFDGTPEGAEFELSFIDPDGLYGSTTRRVVADSAARNVEIAFAPAPTLLPLERETQSLLVLTRPMPGLAAGEAVERLVLSLLVKHDAGAAQPLAAQSVELGGSVEFRIPSQLLGPPGPLELSVNFAGSGSTRATQTVAHATATAMAELSLLEPLPPSRPEAGVRLHVGASSGAGPVPSGSVEARVGGTSLGSARVSHGVADLYVQLEESLAKSRPIELRYVPDAPWWLPAAPLLVTIPIAPPSPWRRIFWIAAVTALGAWLLWSWQRPRRIERSLPSPHSRHAARVPVDLVEPGDGQSGWRGEVLDAHDGNPIAGAVVCIRLPSFSESGVLQSAQTDAAGAFQLDRMQIAGPGAALEVRAPLHSPLVAPMPPAGTLVLSLTSRRRTLLERFVSWARRDGGWERSGEATPGELARRSDRSEVAEWASAVDEAAFGPEPLSEAKERGLLELEPPHNRNLPVKLDHS